MKYLKDKNGETWKTSDGKEVPAKCPVCGADMGLFILGEPVFLCKGKEHHCFGVLMFEKTEE